MCLARILLLSCFLGLSSTTRHQRPRDGYNTFSDTSTNLPYFKSLRNLKWNEPHFDVSVPNNVTALVGKSAYLSCKVRNLGNKTVSWIRHRDLHILTVGTYTFANDQRFSTTFHREFNEWTMHIKWVQDRDAGFYECQVSTQPIRSYSVRLNVVEPTAAILNAPDLYVDKGSTINLTCTIRFGREPPGFIFWYHEDKEISFDSERGGISMKTHTGDMTTSYLLVENADIGDSGKYTCAPSNTGPASVKVHVFLHGERPEAMQTGSSISPTSTCFLTSTIAILIGLIGALSGNCDPLPSSPKICRAIYEQFTQSKYAHSPQTTLISIVMGISMFGIIIANQCIHIAVDLPSG